MNLRWRLIIGPVITTVTVVGIFLADRHVLTVPNPGAFSFIAVVFSAYLGGVVPGLVSAAISIGYAALAFSEPDQILHFSRDNLARIGVLIIATPLIALMVGVLKQRAVRALEREQDSRRTVESENHELLTLQAALHQIDDGVVLLDRELRAQFINRAFRRMTKLPDDKADSKPAFVGLVYHGRDTGAYSVAPGDIDAYVAERVALVRAGDASAIDIHRSFGDVIRFKCTALPDGGRMLSYSDVTDLVRNAERLAELAALDGMTGLHNRRHFLALAVAEWNRFQRYGRPLALLILDIDLFKSINDRFGHGGGDQAIVHVADLCRENRRDTDVVGRIGGEEFALLLPRPIWSRPVWSPSACDKRSRSMHWSCCTTGLR